MNTLFTEELMGRIHRTGVIAVLVVDRVEDAVPLARALVAGGIDVMELTLRTPAAFDALKRITIEVPQMTAGIGTVITPEQVNQVKEAGAAFGMAPGMNPLVVREAHRVGLPFAPGIATPSDIEQALGCRCRLLKYFPAEACGGMEYLKSMSAPYAHLNLKYIPLGGLNANNVETYLKEPIVHALGGSWIAPRDLVKKQDWTAITVNARQASEIVAKARPREIA